MSSTIFCPAAISLPVILIPGSESPLFTGFPTLLDALLTCSWSIVNAVFTVEFVLAHAVLSVGTDSTDFAGPDVSVRATLSHLHNDAHSSIIMWNASLTFLPEPTYSVAACVLARDVLYLPLECLSHPPFPLLELLEFSRSLASFSRPSSILASEGQSTFVSVCRLP